MRHRSSRPVLDLNDPEIGVEFQFTRRALFDLGFGNEVLDNRREAAVAGAKPLSRNRYKVQLARVAVQRALFAATGMET